MLVTRHGYLGSSEVTSAERRILEESPIYSISRLARDMVSGGVRRPRWDLSPPSREISGTALQSVRGHGQGVVLSMSEETTMMTYAVAQE